MVFVVNVINKCLNNNMKTMSMGASISNNESTMASKHICTVSKNGVHDPNLSFVGFLIPWPIYYISRKFCAQGNHMDCAIVKKNAQLIFSQ